MADPSHALMPAPELARELSAGWPLPQRARTDGYRPLPLERARVVDAARFGERAAVAVVADAAGARAALPIVDDERWRVAAAGDGVTRALLEWLGRSERTSGPGHEPGFRLRPFAPFDLGDGSERALGTDQTNASVVVSDRVIVKWRTSFGADGLRALTLRRHLAETGFAAMPPLLGALTWIDAHGSEVVLADVDGLLPHAQDGWDTFIAELIERLDAPPEDPLELAGTLGRLTGELHAALSTPSPVIPAPVHQVGREAVASWREAGLGSLARAVGIEAQDGAVLHERAPRLRRAIDGLVAVDSTSVQPVHGDLHIGQVIRGEGGMAVIDFDGPPGTRPASGRAEPFERQPAARDVAQLLCSLDLLAVVVDARSEGRHEAALATWMEAARAACLGGYRERAPAGLLDERLLGPFLAEQICRELVYAADVLPRWRYAPMGALRWRYPEVEG